LPDRDMRLTVDPAWRGEVCTTPAKRIFPMATVRPDGRKLRQMREEANLSLRELSRRTELSESTVRKAERPRPWESVEVRTLQLLAEVYGVNWMELTPDR
jgi:DNA-binding XRE family transcriptional regulator